MDGRQQKDESSMSNISLFNLSVGLKLPVTTQWSLAGLLGSLSIVSSRRLHKRASYFINLVPQIKQFKKVRTGRTHAACKVGAHLALQGSRLGCVG